MAWQHFDPREKGAKKSMMQSRGDSGFSMHSGMAGLMKNMQDLQWSEQEMKALVVACSLQSITVSSGGTRQVVAACTSTYILTILILAGKYTQIEHVESEYNKENVDMKTDNGVEKMLVALPFGGSSQAHMVMPSTDFARPEYAFTMK